MFDTHCHLNFSRFKKNVDEVIVHAHEVGVHHIMIPGTDVKTSIKAVDIAEKNENIYAAVGIHPHHVYEMKGEGRGLMIEDRKKKIEEIISQLQTLLSNSKVLAVGEIGLDRHVYEETKYAEYNVDESFIELQKILFIEQLKLATEHNKSLIIHNREAKTEMLQILHDHWDKKLEGRAVFHCCEPDIDLLTFAKEHHMFLGVDGDITYYPEKQEFIKNVPLSMLVLETDSPFLLPEPLKSKKLYPNEPKNIPLIAAFIADILQIEVTEITNITTQNSMNLFHI